MLATEHPKEALHDLATYFAKLLKTNNYNRHGLDCEEALQWSRHELEHVAESVLLGDGGADGYKSEGLGGRGAVGPAGTEQDYVDVMKDVEEAARLEEDRVMALSLSGGGAQQTSL